MTQLARGARPRSAVLARTCLTLALLAGAASAQDRPPLERDLWYAYVDGDERYGSHHLQVSALSDGRYSYRVSARLLLDLFAIQRQEITVVADYVVAADLRPVSMRIETESLSGTGVIVGRMNEDSFTLSDGSAGAGEEAVFPVDPAATVLFSISVDDWLAGLDPTTEGATAQVISEETLALETIVVTCVRHDVDGSEWIVDSEAGGEETRMTLDARGALLEALTPTPRELVVRCTEDEARDLEYRSLDGPEVLTFPLDRDISAPHRLEELVVRLTWRDIPFADFELEDARQQVLERSESSAGRTAVVRILAPPPVGEPATIPVEDAALAPYLAETDYIKPADPAIVAAAEAAIAGTTDAGEAVAALSRWVFEFLEAELIAETLSGPEVLALGKGKCTEYSTLFASMARAVGIPTRVALGERMASGSWMGHMWNEAWIGRWVTVDASANEVDRSPVLLKFIHSDTVQGTQPLRWALTESLSISIEDFRLAESALAGTYETGVEGVTYTNVDYAARITAPAEDWTLIEASEGGAPVIGLVPPDTEDVAIHFVVFGVPEGSAAKTFIDARLGHWKRTFEEHEVLASEARVVRGAKGHASRFLGRGDEDDGSDSIRITEVCWVRGSSGYLLTMNSKAPVHDEWQADFEKLLAGFLFLDE